MDYLEKVLKLSLIFLFVGCGILDRSTSNEITIPIKTSVARENPQTTLNNSCKWQVRFSPNGGAEKQVVDTILSATQSIYVLSYSFTSDNIAKSLVHMNNSNLDVQVILDPSNKTGKGSDFSFLLKSGVPTYIDDKHAIAHNKVIIVDLRYILTGSFNFTSAAEKRNAENSLLLDCPELAKIYLENWKLHKDHSMRQIYE
jgi:phosphatidylserine/phosphatidylglycerophosphate/cardiolipin synthase-like enzyme